MVFFALPAQVTKLGHFRVLRGCSLEVLRRLTLGAFGKKVQSPSRPNTPEDARTGKVEGGSRSQSQNRQSIFGFLNSGRSGTSALAAVQACPGDAFTALQTSSLVGTFKPQTSDASGSVAASGLKANSNS